MLSFIRVRERERERGRIQKLVRLEGNRRDGIEKWTCYGAVNTRMKVGFLFRLVSLDVERTGHRPAIAFFSAIPEHSEGGSFLT